MTTPDTMLQTGAIAAPAAWSATKSRQRLADVAVLLVLAASVTGIVLSQAWVSDDAMITFRYVSNLLGGEGPVFNAGDRVQGYTHPLWFMLLSLTTLVTQDEIYAAVALGGVFTFVAGIVLSRGLLDVAQDRLAGLMVAVGVLALLAGSDSWRSFQTSGLEGSLSTLLIVLLVLAAVKTRPSAPAMLLLGCLLVLTRPDLALIAGPVCLLAMRDVFVSRKVLPALAALTPLVWFIFAYAYYGDFIPNTAATKLGIFTPGQAIGQGQTYLFDWLVNEPQTVAGCALLLAFGIAKARRAWDWALVAGVIAYVLYVVVIGGDFMRGRFFMPVLVASITFGGLALARSLRLTGRSSRLCLAMTVVASFAIAGLVLTPKQGGPGQFANSGIVNEHLFYYPMYAFRNYVGQERLDNYYLGTLTVEDLQAYVAACGPTTIHSRNPAYLGYYVGPQLMVIDMLGLNDSYIARLPNEYLLQRPPRVGHPERRIPISYLASRGDIALLPDWREGLKTLDCSMKDRAQAMRNDTGLFTPRGAGGE